MPPPQVPIQRVPFGPSCTAITSCRYFGAVGISNSDGSFLNNTTYVYKAKADGAHFVAVDSTTSNNYGGFQISIKRR